MKIGEFAKICNTRISVLRHYDRKGLLKPAYIDCFTGYRYYSAQQAAVYERITALKQAGFSLAQIRKILAQGISDADLMSLFDHRKEELDTALQNLEEARRLITGGTDMSELRLKEIGGMLTAVGDWAEGEDFKTACSRLHEAVVKNDCQRISAFFRDEGNNEAHDGQRRVCCQIVRLKKELDPLRENIDLPFEEEGGMVGKWEIVGEYAVESDFYESEKSPDREKGCIYFLPGGERYWCYGWTKGKLLIDTGDTTSVNAYEKKEIEGKKYLFVFLKSYYYRRGGKPEVLVLRQMDQEKYSAEELARKDRIDLPFEDDRRVIGKWAAFDFIPSKEQFRPEGHGKIPEYFREITFLEGGSCVSVYGDEIISGDEKQVWTKGYVLRKWNHSACAYEIRRTHGKDFLILEWKSGDYRWGGFDTDYYVFTRSVRN